MGTLLTAVAWPAVAACAVLIVSSFVRTGRLRRWKDPGRWYGPLVFLSAMAVLLTLAGVFKPLAGVLLAAVPLVLTAAVLAGPFRALAARDGHRAAAGRLLSGLGWRIRGDLQYALRDIRALLARLRGGDEPDEMPAPPAPADGGTRAVPVPRVIPSIRDDDTLGAAPAAADVAAGLAGAGVPVPPAWAALCESVSSHEPDTDEDELAFIAGHAAGHLAYADAWRARAENLQHGTGLDPAYVAGNFEFADEVGESASALAMVSHRFHVVYGAVRSWIAGGGVLPNNGRWLTGDGGSAQQDDGEAAA